MISMACLKFIFGWLSYCGQGEAIEMAYCGWVSLHSKGSFDFLAYSCASTPYVATLCRQEMVVKGRIWVYSIG